MHEVLEPEKRLESVSGTEKVDLLNELAFAEHTSDPEAADRHLRKALDLARELDYRKGEATNLMFAGVVRTMNGAYPAALAKYEDALAIFESEGDKSGIAQVCLKIAQCYRSFDDYSASAKYLHRACVVFEEIDDRSGVASCHMSMGSLYRIQRDFDSALEQLHIGLKVYESYGDASHVSAALNNIGLVCTDREAYDEALESFDKSVQARVDVGDSNSADLALTYSNMGEVYRATGNHPKAIEYCELALRMAESVGHQQIVISANGNLGKVYADMGETIRAQDHLGEALRISREIGARAKEMECCEALSKLAESVHEFRDALEYHKQYHALRVELHEEEKKLTTSKMQAECEVRQAHRKTEVHRQKNAELEELNGNLTEAMANLRQLQGMLPICAWCKSIRDDKGYWNELEEYVAEHTEADFSHSICPDCLDKRKNDTPKSN